jgi:hypothetical protein
MSAQARIAAEVGGPRITIAIPTFNRASLLRECVASALAQRYRLLEVLVSDNASTDATQRTLAQFDDDRLRVLTQKTNIGLIPNWNACLESAKGEYIVFLSDDDRLAPWMVERCLELVLREPQIPIVVALSNLYGALHQRTKPARVSKHLATGICSGTKVLNEFLTDNITVTMCSVMLRTDLLRARGGIPPEYPHTADVASWAPLLFLGRAGFVNEACATFCYHSASETSRLGVEQLIRDGSKVADLIAGFAASRLTGPAKHKMIKHTKACFARRGLIVLSDFMRGGGSTKALVHFVWQFRNDLIHANRTAIIRFAATLLCPPSIAPWLRAFAGTVPAQKRSRSTQGSL